MTSSAPEQAVIKHATISSFGLSAMFAILKSFGYIEMSWLWVLSPLCIWYGFVFLVSVLFLVVCCAL